MRTSAKINMCGHIHDEDMLRAADETQHAGNFPEFLTKNLKKRLSKMSRRIYSWNRTIKH